MNVIWHDHEFIYSHAGYAIAGENMLTGDLSGFCQPNMRGVEGAAPYDVTQNTTPVFCTKGKKIGARRIVIVAR